MANRLANETSPYLLQHKDNPVNWNPWDEEALSLARSQDRPILLSIGYSACHWCHVMEHESFENPEIASLMNEHFVCVKVDREERPDLDSIYMNAVQALTGRGGWPMTVFLTPDLRPFYAGTYFPPTDRQGMPGFNRVLLGVATAYRTQRDQIERSASGLVENLRRDAFGYASTSEPSPKTLDSATSALLQGVDWNHGGFGAAPKFPQAMALEYLLRQSRRGVPKADEALRAATLTLDRMARGGIYDQLGGGFHRYSVDTYWLVPHFEKMLYDNALLSRVYLHAYRLTREPLYRRVVEETLDFVLRDLTSPDGGFYSTLDADSEGEEGKYYVWTPTDIREALAGDKAADDARLIETVYGVRPAGNFEGKTIFRRAAELETLSGNGPFVADSADALERRLVDARARLLRKRTERVPPARDEKMLTAWNGLMLRAFAEAGFALDRMDYLEAAEKNARFLWENFASHDESGKARLMRTAKGSPSAGEGGLIVKLNGYLEDYSYFASGLIALYEATGVDEYLFRARELAETMLQRFWSEEEGQFFDTSDDHESLILRPRNLTDNATPSASSVAVGVLLRLGAIFGDERYREAARNAISSVEPLLERYPSAFGELLCALDLYLVGPIELAIVYSASGRTHGDDRSPRELLSVFRDGYYPNVVLAQAIEPVGSGAIASAVCEQNAERAIPLLENRAAREGRATAYVCRRFVCETPVNDAESLRRLLDAASLAGDGAGTE